MKKTYMEYLSYFWNIPIEIQRQHDFVKQTSDLVYPEDCLQWLIGVGNQLDYGSISLVIGTKF